MNEQTCLNVNLEEIYRLNFICSKMKPTKFPYESCKGRLLQYLGSFENEICSVLLSRDYFFDVFRMISGGDESAFVSWDEAVETMINLYTYIYIVEILLSK